MENEKFSFNAFIEDSKNALLKPKEYFTSMRLEGGYGVPIIKALLYGTIAGVFSLIWSLLNLSAFGGMLGGLFGGAVGILGLIGSIIGALIGLFIGAVLILLFAAIVQGKTDFEPAVRISAALMVLSPVGAFLSLFDGLSFTLGAILTLAIRLYGLWMLYHAVTISLKGKVDTAKIISYVLAGLLALFFLLSFGARNRANKFMRGFEDITKNAEDYQKAIDKSMKDISKELEKAANEMEEEK